MGYQADFIGPDYVVELPSFDTKLKSSVLKVPGSLRDGLYSDHTHFTLVMNKHTRQLIYAASNINQVKLREDAAGTASWRFDPNFDAKHQLGNDYYKDRTDRAGRKISNPYDRGHMVMRFNNMWGANDAEAHRAGAETFIYSNASLQHENLNRDEWKEIEMEIVRKLSDDANDRLCVFTGPIYGDLDRHINLSDRDSARVPSGFFKVICFQLKQAIDGDQLGVYAFAVFQDSKVLRDKKGHDTVKTDREYQVTIKELQELTGIQFGERLYRRNPLFYYAKKERATDNNVSFFPERVPLNRVGDLVAESEAVRASIEPLSKRRIAIVSAMIDPPGSEKAGEWILLHNRSAHAVSLRGWRLVDGAGRSTTLAGRLKPGEARTLSGGDLGTIRLANQGGRLMLYGDDQRIIDHVTWSKRDVDRLGEGIAFLFERGQ